MVVSVAISVAVYLVVHCAMEAAYLSLYGKSYLNMLRGLARDPRPSTSPVTFAVLSYAILFAATYYFVFRAVEEKRRIIRLPHALGHGALFGLCVYGVYNFTNLYAFRGYDLRTAARDVAYGTLSMAFVAFAAWRLAQRDHFPDQSV